MVAAVGIGAAAILTTPTDRSEAAEARPNIVLVVTDDQTSDISKMPYINSGIGWVRFDRTFVNIPLCCPSRATILTGQYSHHTGVEENHDGQFLDDSSTIATWLQGAGYRTSFVGKYLNHYPWQLGNYKPPGWSDWHAYTAQHSYYNYSLIENGTEVAYGSAPTDYSTDVLARKAVRFLSRPNDRPFFLYFAPIAPHNPATPAPRHQGTFASLSIPHSPNFNEADLSDKSQWWQALPPKNASQMDAAYRRQYEADLAVDNAVRSIFQTLEATGRLDNTVVVYTSDNGVAFGAHRWGQKQCPYEECVRVPLLIRYPGLTSAARGELASNVDLAPTLADLAGTTPTSPVDGYSLRPALLAGGGDRRSYVLMHNKRDPDYAGDQSIPPTWWAVRSKRYKYVEWPDTGEQELYDLVADPFELRSLAGDPAYRAKVQELDAKLDQLREQPPRDVAAAGADNRSR